MRKTGAEASKIVFNEASFRNVFGYSILWWILVTLFVWLLIRNWHRPVESHFSLLVGGGLLLSLPLSALIYIFFYGGKSATVVHDGVIIESWLSQMFHLDRQSRIRWEDIVRVHYRVIGTPRGATDKLYLYTSNQRFVFWTVCFDFVELQRLAALLSQHLKPDQMTGSRVWAGRKLSKD